jgi:hypothetical protein
MGKDKERVASRTSTAFSILLFAAMVLFFTSAGTYGLVTIVSVQCTDYVSVHDPAITIYMGKDKFESPCVPPFYHFSSATSLLSKLLR